MLNEIKNLYSPVTDVINKIKKYLSNYELITDLICKLVITFGVVLLIGGLSLIFTNGAVSTQTIQTVVSSINWVPGIPYNMSNLLNLSTSTIGLATWFIGLDLLLMGLGLWVRHRLARFTAILIFGLAACFQFIEFIYAGLIGSPASLIGIIADVLIVYFLFARFDSKSVQPYRPPQNSVGSKMPT